MIPMRVLRYRDNRPYEFPNEVILLIIHDVLDRLAGL